MKSVSLLALLVVLTLDSAAVKAAKLPATFKLCKKKDPNINECLRIAMQQAITDLARSGVPALHLASIDPLAVTKMAIEDGAGKPVRLNLELHNVSANGFSKAEIKTLRADLENRVLEGYGLMPEASIEADYVMDGQFLVLPLKGKGKCKIECIGLNTTLKVEAEPQKKSGDVYWNVFNFGVHVNNLDLFRVRFDNLFNGDKALSENTNKILNENWQQLWQELKPSFEGAFSAIFQQLANQVFSRVPEKDIFLE